MTELPFLCKTAKFFIIFTPFVPIHCIMISFPTQLIYNIANEQQQEPLCDRHRHVGHRKDHIRQCTALSIIRNSQSSIPIPSALTLTLQSEWSRISPSSISGIRMITGKYLLFEVGDEGPSTRPQRRHSYRFESLHFAARKDNCTYRGDHSQEHSRSQPIRGRYSRADRSIHLVQLFTHPHRSHCPPHARQNRIHHRLTSMPKPQRFPQQPPLRTY
jgi:hypothetical protein